MDIWIDRCIKNTLCLLHTYIHTHIHTLPYIYPSCSESAGRSLLSSTGGPSILGQSTNACCLLMDAGLPPGTIRLNGTETNTHTYTHYTNMKHISQLTTLMPPEIKVFEGSNTKNAIHGITPTLTEYILYNLWQLPADSEF